MSLPGENTMTNDSDCSSSQTNASGSEDSNSDRDERPSGNMNTPPRDEDVRRTPLMMRRNTTSL